MVKLVKINTGNNPSYNVFLWKILNLFLTKSLTMAGNTFGNIFKITTFGESHGAALGGVIVGVLLELKLILI